MTRLTGSMSVSISSMC